MMNKPVYRSFSAIPAPPVQRMLGVVLPVVLVVLTVLTGLVVTQIRRSTIDERLAANTRESVHLDSSVQTVLRWCEARVTQQPQGTITVTPAPDNTSLPAWDATSANWNNATSLDFQGGAAVWGLTADPSCVIEDATCELAPPISPTGQTGASACPGNGDLDPRWRKFRITARVVAPAVDMIGGNRTMYAQSELRLFIE
jgi:Tfp pilus assembly protein PilX